MKKNVTKIISILLVFSLMFSYTSCKDSHEGQIQVPDSAEGFKHKNYKDVQTQFELAGFRNIELEPIDDLVLGWLTSDGEVESVSVNGKTDFSDGDWYTDDAKILIRYHTFPEKKTEENTIEKETEVTTEEETTEMTTEETTEKETTETTTEEKTTETTTEKKTTETTTEVKTEEENSEPISVTHGNIKGISVGDYVTITGPANVLCCSTGKIKVGGNDTGTYSKCGIQIKLYKPGDDTGVGSYTVEALKVDPGEFEDEFYSHAPADFSPNPRTIAGREYAGCRVTITGTVDKILINEEEGNYFHGISLGKDAVVENLEFFYD